MFVGHYGRSRLLVHGWLWGRYGQARRVALAGRWLWCIVGNGCRCNNGLLDLSHVLWFVDRLKQGVVIKQIRMKSECLHGN